MDDYQEVSHRSYGNKLCEACGCAVVGLLVFAASGPLIWYNEGRAVYTAKAIAAGARSVVEAPCAPIDPAFEGRLVHMSCAIEGLESFTLLHGALTVNATAFLQTEAQMYQWVERSATSSRKDALGGGTTTTTTYTYARDWAAHAIDSSAFKRPVGAAGVRHANPPASAWPERTAVQRAARLRAGAHALSAKLAERIHSSAPVAMAPRGVADGGMLPARQPPAKLEPSNTVVGADGWLYSADPRAPVVGAVRVRYRRSAATRVSVLAAQRGEGFGAWEGDASTPSNGPGAFWPQREFHGDDGTRGAAPLVRGGAPARSAAAAARRRLAAEAPGAALGAADAGEAGNEAEAWPRLGGRAVPKGYGLLELAEGELSARQMLAAMTDANGQLTWALRACGLVASWAGASRACAEALDARARRWPSAPRGARAPAAFTPLRPRARRTRRARAHAGLMMIGRPLAVMPDAVPCVGPAIGELAGCALGCAALCVAIMYTCLVGALAWLRFRPLLAAALLSVAAGAACALGGARQRCGPARGGGGGGGRAGPSASAAPRPRAGRLPSRLGRPLGGWAAGAGAAPGMPSPPQGSQGSWACAGSSAPPPPQYGLYPAAMAAAPPTALPMPAGPPQYAGAATAAGCQPQHPPPSAPPPPPGYYEADPERAALLRRAAGPSP